MTKYFELLLDLLDITSKDDYLKIAKIIEDNHGKKFEIYHQHAPIFRWYIDLLDDAITVEKFLSIWDINSDILYNPDRWDSISFLRENNELDDDTIYILDLLSEGIIQPRANVFYI
jgi:hypothetical protein